MMAVFMSIQPDWLARVQAVVTCKGALLLRSFFKKGFMKPNQSELPLRMQSFATSGGGQAWSGK